MWNLKKFTSGFVAMAVAASAFVAVPLSAGAKNTSDGNVQALQDFEAYVAGDVTTVVGTSFTDSGSTQIERLTPNTSSGSRIIFNNSAIVQDGSNKYFSTEIKPNNGTRTDFYNVGALYFGGRDGTAYNRSLGQTRIFTADVRFYGATQIILADQTNSTPRSGYKDYLDLSYASGTITWAGSGSKSVDSGWHNIVVVDTAGSSFVEGTGVTHTTKLYVDGDYVGSNSADQNSTANGANHIGFAAFLAATTTQTKIDVDNLEIFTLAQDTANTAVISVENDANAYINPTSETKTLQLHGKVVHNTTDNIDITDFYTTAPTWTVEPAVPGVSVNSNGLVTVDSETFDTESNDSATIVYTAGTKTAYINVAIGSEEGYELITTPYAQLTIDNNSPVSTGKTGIYTFPLNDNTTHSVTITKPNYTSKENVSVTTQNNGSTDLTLTPAEGYYYYEGFDYVDDGDFGFDSGVSISNGVLDISLGSGSTSTTITSTSVAGKTIHLTTHSHNASANHYGYLSLDGTGLSLYYYSNQVRLHGKAVDLTKNVNTDFGIGIDNVDIVFNGTKADYYADGKYIGSVYHTGTELTGLTATQNKGTFHFTISDMAVKNTPTVFELKAEDNGTKTGTSGNYLSGYIASMELPQPVGNKGHTFTGWSNDGGTTLVPAGTTVTATTATTYTAVYESNTGTITPKYVAANGTTQLGGTIASNGYGGANGSTIATAFALDTTNVPQETTMTGIAWEINVPNNGAYVRTNNTSNWTKTVEGSPVTYIDSENGIASGVESYNIYPVSTSFTLRLMHQLPHVTGAEVIVGLVVDNLYIPSNSTVTANYITTAYNASDEAYAAYDKLDLGTLTDGVYNATVGTSATLSETTAFGELMSIDSILTMMYDEDELAEITGDIASENNADITGIDDEIDMTDYNDNGEAVGE